MAGETQKVVLGAGKWYVTPWTKGVIDFKTLCVDDNLIGYTSGGATVTYTPETYTIEDDLGMVKRTFQTKGSAEMKTGLLTWNVKSVSELLSSGKLTEKAATTSANGEYKLELSGGKESLKQFCVAFVYEDDSTGLKMYFGMVSSNTSAISMAFAKDKETTLDLTFTGESNGVDDTILTIVEETAKTA